MPGFISDQDSDLHPPAQGIITALALAAGVASTSQLSVSNGGTGTSNRSQFVTFACDQVFYLTMGLGGGAGGPVDPVIATVGTGAGVTMGPYPANTMIRLRIPPAHRYFKVISAAVGTFRWYVSEGDRTI